MKLVLHIGTHKTATTTIQKVLARNRGDLLKHGVWYPAYSEIFPGMPDHYAHLDVAKGLMYESKKFTPETVALFFERLHERAPRIPNLKAVLISAEPFYRGRTPGDLPYWMRREKYVSKLRKLIPFQDVDVVLVFRRQDDYLESLYNEHVKTTRYSKDIWTFLSDYRSRFEYGRQIRVWSEHFPILKVHTFEDLVKSGNVTRAFLEAVLGLRHIALEDIAQESNVSLPLELVEFKRLLNSTSLSRPELRDVVLILEAVAKARRGRGKPEPVSRLSQEDCRRVLTEFEEDNEWINGCYFAGRVEGLFPSEIRTRLAMPDLTPETCAHIFAEIVGLKLFELKN